MKRHKSTELPYVTLSIPVSKFIELVQNRFQDNLMQLNLIPGQEQSIESALKKAVDDILAEKFAIDGTVELVQFPLGSMAASGKFADPDAGRIVYVPGTGSHKPYIRKWVIPPNINSDKQQEHRTRFKLVTQQWQLESPEIKSEWELAAEKVPVYSGQTLYIKRWFKVGKETGTYPGIGFQP